MYGLFAASLPLRRTHLAVGLCLLAFLFALEAKAAWYEPTAGPARDISAAKALPACSPELVEHGVPTPDPAHPHITFASLPANVTLWLPKTNFLSSVEANHGHFSFFRTSHFSPSLFFRPPPTL